MQQESMFHRRSLRMARTAALALGLALLGGCGGGGGYSIDSTLLDPVPLSSPQCASIDNQKSWLYQYMNGAYYWTAHMPSANPAQYAGVEDYFLALRWAPTDHYSFTMSEQEYTALFQSGQETGYGIEWKNDPAYATSSGDPGPIRVAYVEPGSPAALADVRRGDTLVAINGSSPSTQGAIDLLFPTQTGTPITLELRGTGELTTFSVALNSTTITRDAVFDTRVLNAANGAKVGYLAFNQFLAPSSTLPELRTAFQTFQQAAVSDLVLDLRYNGGGYVSMANELAAMIAGNRVSTSNTFIRYYYNDQNAGYDHNDYFVGIASDTALSLPRVFVLTSPRTASASELVINALKPYMTVVQIGELSYGKPVGQIPVANCGQVFAPVVFETVNANGNGGYFNGIAPTCTTVLDDLDHALGDTGEAVLGQAMAYINAGGCPVAIASTQAVRAPSSSATVNAALPDRVRNRALLR